MENELDTEVLNSEENLDSNQETEEVVYQDNSELVKAKEIAENQRIRAEKAERELKALKKPVQTEKETPKNEGMSAKDVIAIRDLHEADLEFVMAEAKLRGKTIAEVKANPYIQNTLKVMAEERKTAEAVNTGSARKNNSKSSDEALMERVDSQQLSKEEMERAADLIFRSYGKK
jgi:hypothetical protein